MSGKYPRPVLIRAGDRLDDLIEEAFKANIQ